MALVLGVMAAVVASGVAAAAVFASSGSSLGPVAGLYSDRNQGSAQAEDAGIHGGPIDRFHKARAYDLADVSGLPGSWAHGDYVSAVSGAGGAVTDAARSDCGKPMVSVEHGPPSNALEKIQEHTQGGKPDAVPAPGS